MHKKRREVRCAKKKNCYKGLDDAFGWLRIENPETRKEKRAGETERERRQLDKRNEDQYLSGVETQENLLETQTERRERPSPGHVSRDKQKKKIDMA